jgi:hypothetical protein
VSPASIQRCVRLRIESHPFCERKCVMCVGAGPVEWSPKYPFLGMTVSCIIFSLGYLENGNYAGCVCGSSGTARFACYCHSTPASLPPKLQYSLILHFALPRPRLFFRTLSRPMQFSALLLDQLVLAMIPQRQGQNVLCLDIWSISTPRLRRSITVSLPNGAHELAMHRPALHVLRAGRDSLGC